MKLSHVFIITISIVGVIYFIHELDTKQLIQPVQANQPVKANPVPDEKDFNNKKEAIMNSVNAISSYGASQAVEELKNNINYFNNIKNTVKNAQNVDDVMVQVADGLSKIAESYKKIASKKESIFSVHQKEIKNFMTAEGETLDSINTIKIKKNDNIDKIANWEKDVNSISNDIEKQKIQISLRATKSVVKSLEAQEEIWNKFYNAQEKLLPKLKLNSEKIGLMFHILNANAEVYQEAATAAKLRRSALVALENLSSLTDLEELIKEMSNNWSQVDNLVQEISSADFRIQ